MRNLVLIELDDVTYAALKQAANEIMQSTPAKVAELIVTKRVGRVVEKLIMNNEVAG